MTGTSLNTLEACLENIRRHDDAVNAFITVTEDSARESARAADHAAAHIGDVVLC